MAKKPRYQKLIVDLPSSKIFLYAGTKVRSALEELKGEMKLYHGVRFTEVLEAVYQQGQKDGRKEIIERMDGIKAAVNYLPPGRPKKKKAR
jgi:hypothetical protein